MFGKGQKEIEVYSSGMQAIVIAKWLSGRKVQSHIGWLALGCLGPRPTPSRIGLAVILSYPGGGETHRFDGFGVKQLGPDLGRPRRRIGPRPRKRGGRRATLRKGLVDNQSSDPVWALSAMPTIYVPICTKRAILAA